MTHQEAEVSGEKTNLKPGEFVFLGIDWGPAPPKLVPVKWYRGSATWHFGPDEEDEPDEDEDRISAIWRNETDKREGWVKREPAFNPFARIAQLDQAACCVGPKVKA